MDLEGLKILDKNELNVFSDGRLIYVYDVNSELRGKQTITFELELPVLYENNKEVAYPFGSDWHIQWFDEVYYLNTVKPSGVKNNEKRTIKYTLVFEGLSNKLDNVLIRNFARVYVDENHDGFADDEEIITDIELSSTPAFYGNIYDFVAYIRKNLNYIYGYLNDEYQTVGGNKTVIPKYLIKFANIDYVQNGKLVAENFLEIETAESNTTTHRYSTSDRVSIELDGLSLLEALKKLNENFTYKEVVNNNTEDVGYSFSFGTIDLYSDGGLVKTDTNEKYTIPCIIINPLSRYVVDGSNNAVVFEYGGLTKDGGLLEITRTTDENKVANRIYGKGSGDNLPVNYFRIYENEAIEGQAEDGQKYFQTQEELSQKVTNPDPTKVYLVEDEEFANVYDKWVWTRDEALILSASTSNETSVKIAENNTLPNVATGESISDIYLKQDDLDSLKYYAYWYNSLELQWESLGVWNKDGLMWGGTEQKTEPDFVSFFNSGDNSKEVEQSEVLVLIREGANVTTQDNKVYAYVSNNGSVYICEYKKKYYGLGWIPQGYMTYERVNPYPKHISSITNLMPECFRAYLAGWRYGYFYAKDNNNTAQNLNLAEVDTDDLIETVTVLPTTATANKIYRKKDIFYLVYIYTKDSNGNLNVPILLGIYDDNTKGYFKKGLKDYAIGIIENAGIYNYTNCGRIYKPTNYYEDEELINLYGVIEKKEDFSDIKPSIVGQYISGLGRLDEVVDVYIPNNGYYWKDNQYINTIDGRRYNTQVPNLYIPQIMDGEMIISTSDFRVQTVNKNIYRALFNDVSTVSNYIYQLNTDTILSEEIDLSNIDFSVRSAMVLDMRVRGNIALKKDTIYNNNTAIDDFFFPCISYEVVLPLYYRVLRKEENGNTFEEISSKKLLGTLKKKVTYGIKFVKDGAEYSIKTPAKERIADELWIDGFVYEYKDEGAYREVVYFSNGSTLFIQDNHPSTNITNKNDWKKYIAKQYGAAGWTQEEEDGFTMEYDIIEEDYTESLNDDYYIEERGIYKVELSTQKNIVGYVNSVINAQSYVNRLYCPLIVKRYVQHNSNVRFEVGKVDKINSVLDIYEIWDYTTKEFFVWIKDIKFNPLLPAFQGEQAPSITFSTGALAGIDNKFAISTVHCDGFIKAEGERTVNTELSDSVNAPTGNVPSKYMMALKYVESGLTDTNDNQSIFYTLPQNNVQPKAKDLFIINDVRYPHNPYTYSAERKLAEELKKKTDQNVRYTYAVVFDNICRLKKGIDYNLLRTGNRIYIRNNSLVTTYRQGTVYADKYSFIIQQVSVKRTENSLYDTYTLVLGNEKRYYKNTLRDFRLSNPRIFDRDFAISVNSPDVRPNVLSDDVRASLRYNRQDTQITSLNKNYNTLNMLSIDLDKRVTNLENSKGDYRKYDIVLTVTDKEEYKMVEHTKRYQPQLLCIRDDGKRVEIMAEYSSENTLLLTWNERFNGKIYII